MYYGVLPWKSLEIMVYLNIELLDYAKERYAPSFPFSFVV
jgi:hypothetical protein